MDQNLFLFDGLENYLALDLIRKNLIPFNFLTKMKQMGTIKLLRRNLQECRKKKL